MSLEQFQSPASPGRVLTPRLRWNAPEGYVKEAAYYIWEKEGRPHGRDLDHWLRAEHEIRRLVNVGAIRDHNS